MFHSLQLRGNARVQPVVVDIEDKSTVDRRIHYRFQVHLGVQDMRGSRANPVFRLLIDGHGRNQPAGADMFQLPVKIHIHQADKLQIALTPVSQYQSDETDKLPR